MILNKIVYPLVLYNYRFKQIISHLMQFPWFYQNPVYDYFYQQQIKQQMQKYSQLPRRVMIENTNICNAGCVFCPHKSMVRKTGVMALSLYQKIIDQCQQYNIDFVTIYGFGEPLLDHNFVKRVKIAKQAGIKRVTTNTNANFLNKDIVKKLVAAGLDEIYISFDAASVKTYRQIRPNLDFDQVEKNIKFLVQYKREQKQVRPAVYLSFVKTQTNQHEVQAYLYKWKHLVDGISISQIHNWTGQIDSQVKNKGRRDPCRLLWTDMVISWDGKVPLCCNDYENKLVLGDINKQTMRSIWGGNKLAKIRQKHVKRDFKSLALCRYCQYNWHHKSPWWVSQ